MNNAHTTTPQYETLRLAEIVNRTEELQRELRSLPVMGRVVAIHASLEQLEAERTELIDELAANFERHVIH